MVVSNIPTVIGRRYVHMHEDDMLDAHETCPLS